MQEISENNDKEDSTRGFCAGEVEVANSSDGGGFNMMAVSFQNRRSFDSFGYFDRSKNQRHSYTPASCPSSSQVNKDNQVDMFGFGDGFEEDFDYFSL
jgi:hypothetical protein